MRADGSDEARRSTGAKVGRDSESAPEPPDEILEAPDLLDRASALMDDLGLEGEEENRRLVFLSGVGGLLGEPIHLVIKGESSGGKNTLATKALRLLPEDAVLATSGLSPQALAYYEEESGDGARPGLDGVVLIDEAEGLQGAEYLLRQAMSEGRVRRLTVGQDESGRMTTNEREVPVTASFITTTTATALHRENQTRVFDVWIDESEEQTRRVLLAQAQDASGRDRSSALDARVERFRAALAQLRPRPVKIPFSKALAQEFPTHHVRARRDFERLLRLITVSALLHQRQRPVQRSGAIVALPRDYEVIYPLLQEVVKPTMQGLTDAALELSILLDVMVEDSEGSWIRRTELEKEAARQDVARSSTTVRKWARELQNLGYWEGRQVGPHEAWEYRQVRDPFEEPLALPRPEELAEAEEARAEEEEGVSVAVDARAGAEPQGGAGAEEMISIDEAPGYITRGVATN